jgi:LysR family transcriptional activator of nhaA
MPSKSNSLRMNLENWFEQQAIKPLVVAKFDDRALMKAFGERGTGVFTAPQTMEKYGVSVIGRIDEIQEHFYLISPERHIKNPAVTAITEVARKNLFS